MATHHSADARTALMATYIAQWTSPQAGTRFTRATPCPPQSDADRGESEEVFRGSFGARGRTVYNAEAYPPAGAKQDDDKEQCGTLRELERIDAEEEQRRHWDQFLMAARGDFEEERAASSSRETTPTERAVTSEAATAEDMFALYIENNY